MKVTGGSLIDQLEMLKGARGFDSISPKSIPSEGSESGAVQSFGDMLLQKYEETNSLGVEAERAIQRSILGEDQNPHEAVIAVQKASVSLSLMMGVKERLERAFQELIKMPI
jgi:flagellar hook-basal body complex protein FliE